MWNQINDYSPYSSKDYSSPHHHTCIYYSASKRNFFTTKTVSASLNSSSTAGRNHLLLAVCMGKFDSSYVSYRMPSSCTHSQLAYKFKTTVFFTRLEMCYWSVFFKSCSFYQNKAAKIALICPVLYIFKTYYSKNLQNNRIIEYFSSIKNSQ